MGNNQTFKLNPEQMQEFFADWEQAYASNMMKKDFCEMESQKFGVRISKDDLNSWMEKFNPELYEKTKRKTSEPGTPRAPRTTMPRTIPQAIQSDPVVMHQLNIQPTAQLQPNIIITEHTPKPKATAKPTMNAYGNPIIYDDLNQPIEERLTALMDVYEIKLAKCVAYRKSISIKQLMLDALHTYYEQDENKKAVADAHADVHDKYSI